MRGYGGSVDNRSIVATNSDTLLTRGYEARRKHRLDDAKQFFAEAIGLCRATGDQKGLAQALAGLGQIERDLQDLTGARQHYEEAVAVCRTLGDDLKLAHTIRHLGDILRDQGEHVLAESCYTEALQLYRQNERTSALDLANTIRGFALLKGNHGETQAALTLWREAKTLYENVNVQDGVTESDHYLSLLSQT